MRDFVLNQGLKLFMPLVVGFLLPPVMRALKAASEKLGALPADLQRAIVVFLSGLGTALTTFLGVQVTGDPTQWDSAAVSTLLSAAIAFGVHAAQKAKAATPAA